MKRTWKIPSRGIARVVAVITPILMLLSITWGVASAATSWAVSATVSVGSNYPRAVAYGNGYVYVANYNSGTVSVINATTNAVSATIGVGGAPLGIAYVNGYVYVANGGSNTVSVINATTNAVSATVPVGSSPYGVAYGNGYVYVANYGPNTVSVINATTNAVSATVPVGSSPIGVAYGNGYVYVTNDLSSGTVSVISTPPPPTTTTTAVPVANASSTSANSVLNLALTAGSLSVGSTTPSSISAVVGSSGTGSLPSAIWSDTTGSGSGWDGTISVSDFVYTGAWTGTNVATDLVSTASSPYAGFADGVFYSVTVNSPTSVTYTSTDKNDPSGTVSAVTNTPVSIGTSSGLTIDFKSLVTGDVFEIQVGTQSDAALTLANTSANTSATIAVSSSLYTGMPTFYAANAQVALLGGKTNATPSNSTVGSAAKFLTSAINSGMGAYQVSPGATISADTDSWSHTYTANVLYDIVTGP